jgi:hypothetical protein
MVSFHRMYPKVSLELLKHWFRDWRRTAAADPESVQPHFLHEVGRLILSFHDHGGAQLVRYSLAALVSAAPASDGLGARREWLLNLFRELAPRLPEAAHRRQIAAAIVSEGLLDELQASELDDVLRIAAEDLPRLLVQAVDGTGVSSLIHARLATRCAHGLIDRDLGGAGWNHIEEPGYLTLGVTAACRVIERGAYLWDVDAGRNLAWLVWACARALRLQAASWQVGAFVEHQAATDDLAGVRKRMVWILDRLLESPPHMNADMVLRAAAFLYPDLYKPSVPDDMLISFLRQTRRDCRDSRAPLGFRMMTLTHAHALLSGERGRRVAG